MLTVHFWGNPVLIIFKNAKFQFFLTNYGYHSNKNIIIKSMYKYTYFLSIKSYIFKTNSKQSLIENDKMCCYTDELDPVQKYVVNIGNLSINKDIVLS